jgi:hypothetical protein
MVKSEVQLNKTKEGLVHWFCELNTVFLPSGYVRLGLAWLSDIILCAMPCQDLPHNIVKFPSTHTQPYNNKYSL